MAEVNSEATSATRALAGKYLTFAIQRESYGIDVLKIREIIRLTPITAMPQLPAYVKGVINLRGKIIPVIDLRQRFGLAETSNTDLTCIVVVQLKVAAGENSQMGLIVDGVEEVVNVAAGDIEETPYFGAQISSDCVIGLAKLKGSVKALLDIDRVVTGDVTRN